MEKEKHLKEQESVLCEKEKRMECRERARKGDRKGEKGRVWKRATREKEMRWDEKGRE